MLWVTASQGATVKELRAATGMTRERLEAAYEYLLAHPPLGLAVQRRRDGLFLVSAPEVGAKVAPMMIPCTTPEPEIHERTLAIPAH